MSKHINNTTRDIKHLLIPRKAWCPSDMPDAFCYSITCEDGMKGILITGGLALQRYSIARCSRQTRDPNRNSELRPDLHV